MHFSVIRQILIAFAILFSITTAAAYLTTIERKVLGWMQGRCGPNRVGYGGWLQPVADAIKLLRKEYIKPDHANRWLFVLAPLWVLLPSWLSWAFIPVCKGCVYVDAPLGLLWLMALGVISSAGILFAGWASNSKYARLGALRAASQMISYEISLSLSLVSVVIASNSIRLMDVVQTQAGGIWRWHIWPLFPVAVVFWIALLVETHRSPFDVVEGESELVAGYHVEYSGIGFAMFFIAEYSNMWRSCILMSLLFFGGWHSPFEGLGFLSTITAWVPGVLWLAVKTFFWVFCMIWLRSSLPRYRFDQIMYMAWSVLVPWALAWIPLVSFVAVCEKMHAMDGMLVLAVVNAVAVFILYYGSFKTMNKYIHALLLKDILASMMITLKALFSEKSTVEYPEQTTPRSQRFRGLLALKCDDDGQERCIACRLCEAVCPATAITIESHEVEGQRRAHRFDIDAFRCISCGLCQDACPENAIVHTQNEHVVFTQRGQNILTKEVLLALGKADDNQVTGDEG